MVRIRLRRVGARNQPSWRIVAADQRKPRDGRFLEILGHYNPRTEPATVKLDEARLFHWLKNGAQPSEAVWRVLRSYGAWERWERFKEGEDLEALLQEAEAAKIEVDPRTRRDDLVGKRAKRKGEKAPEEAFQIEDEVEGQPSSEEVVEAPAETEADVAEAEDDLETEAAEMEEGEAEAEEEETQEEQAESTPEAVEKEEEETETEEPSADEESDDAEEDEEEENDVAE